MGTVLQSASWSLTPVTYSIRLVSEESSVRHRRTRCLGQTDLVVQGYLRDLRRLDGDQFSEPIEVSIVTGELVDGKLRLILHNSSQDPFYLEEEVTFSLRATINFSFDSTRR